MYCKLFHWFSDNFLKSNPGKCRLLINTYEIVALKLKMKLLLAVLMKNYLVYYSITSLISMNISLHLCRKASQKLNALARVAQYMNLAHHRLIMNAFIFGQFGYCPLVWMFHSRKLNNHINNIHERALRLFIEIMSQPSSNC